ncbi:uncharacterized protein LOC141639999 [Silene latifolia]|uniref:uncharacterized protein LOC141639999 n=1 Tax=Silene latifolia TaxID=37657 RepID=UPI003D779221
MTSAPNVVGFVGLDDDISFDLAASLLRSGYTVKAFHSQNDSHAAVGFSKRFGGITCASAMEAATGVTAVVLLISRLEQINEFILGPNGVVKVLDKNAAVILHTVVLPAEVQKLEKCLTEEYGISVVVDAYVSKGMSEDLKEKLMIVSSGKSNAITQAHPLLSAMCEKLYVFDGEIGAGSKVKMVVDVLEAIHLVAAVEAISLGVQSRIHPWILYDIISNAAGNSWVFKHHVPKWLKADHMKQEKLNTVVESLGIISSLAKSLPFPLPLLAAAQQQLLGCSNNSGGNYKSPLFKVWERAVGINFNAAANEETYDPEELASKLISSSKRVNRIGFIGLGAMGFGMATHLLRSNFTVVGYDVYKPTLSRFMEAGGLVGDSPAEAAKDVEVLVIMVTNEAQAESVLFGDLGAVQALSPGASVILSSTVSPAYVSQLEQRLQGNKLKLVDAPVSGGVVRASAGTLTVMASGTDEALEYCASVLAALSEKLYIIKGGCGSGSCVKMVNQLLAGVHIASSAEALAFGARLGLYTRDLFHFITSSAGTSWMLENRGPHMVNNDFTPYSALNIFVKDLGIISHEGSSRKIPLHVAVTAHQLFLSGSAAGWGSLDDAAVVKFYERLTGVKVEGKLAVLNKEYVLKSLVSEWPVDPINDIVKLCENNIKPLVVLDDDPTGTQTVHDIDVLTEWNVNSLIEQFRRKPKCFFILTNSRALGPDKASNLIVEICTNLKSAAKTADNAEFTVVLRGDSTLRGHFPEEVDAVVSVLGHIDASIICPFFLQGGRFTIGDVHYVAESDRLIPAGDTEFAKDCAFGYNSSNLREWVEEKTKGRIASSNVASVSIDLIRNGGPDAVCEYLCNLEKGATCIVNAASERDMAVFASGMMLAELQGKSFLCRTAASFVSARVGLRSRPPVSPKDLRVHEERAGGLIIVGSYVPKTTKQVDELKEQMGNALKWIEISVDEVALKSPAAREQEINLAAELADMFLRSRMDTVIMTSRQLIVGRTPTESLEINFKVSSALVEIVRRIATRPRYILAKGGITSSDIATKALEAKRAKVVGQALAGVPLWELGHESRHPGVPYIVFPGNVGDHKALAAVVKSWAHTTKSSSTKDLLLHAEKGGYAIGAFNVYNLEGVAAVIAAAEEECSPAILQIHPGALKQGGLPLIACCLSAAKQTTIPVAVHFDHGTSKQELLEILELGLDSLMVDGSHLPFDDNVLYTKYICQLAHKKNMFVEAELGRLSGTEDDLTVEEYEAKLTDFGQARDFIDKTGIDALAVCIGNVHGKYPAAGPNLRLDLLEDLRALTSEKNVSLVLHGASGLPMELVKRCIELGVRKFNVNTEVRKAYMDSLASPGNDLVNVMASAKEAMKAVVAEKMRLFGSAGKAP